VSDDYTPGIIAWFNDMEQKGMVLDVEGHAMAFDFRNLDEQLQETGCHEGHIVAAEISWRNGYGLARMLHAPTVEEFQEHEAVLRDVYQKNQIEQALRKAERRSAGFYNSSR
jgi:hypothetical protein